LEVGFELFVNFDKCGGNTARYGVCSVFCVQTNLLLHWLA